MIDATEKSPLPSAKNAPGSGDVLDGRFRLESRLGRGGFGEVWRASELFPDGTVVREVALKLLSPSLVPSDWAREAKVLASLRHRALVTVFSAGVLETEPKTPFVAMDLLEGKTLAAVITEKGRVPWRRALFFAREIASALDAIHAQGIIHLDLKPSNLLLGDDGVLRVLDFGIARQRGAPARASSPSTERMDDTGDPLGTGALLDLDEPADTVDRGESERAAFVVGTPGFMAPEVVEGREARPAADAYALGACLFQLLTGRIPQRARTLPARGADETEVLAWRAEVRASTVSGDLLRVTELAPRTPAGIARLIERLLALDPAKRPPPAGLSEALDEAWKRPFGVPDPPYLGLSAYGAEAEGFLFGREADADRLARELAERPVLVLQGASGSGKSSLALAGIVPALARTFADGCDDWVPALVRPGQDVDAAVRRAREQAGGEVGVVLVVDQLEELVTQLAPDARARFVLSLSRYAKAGDDEPPRSGGRPNAGLRVLCTLREDFTTRVSALGSLGRLLSDGIRFVPPPSPASVRDIVIAPAALAGAHVDDDRPVVDEVLKELRSGEGRLPLVSFALAEWWQTRQGSTLSAAAWQRIGGVAGALSRHADATLAALPESTRLAARDVCLHLVTPEGTRARVAETALTEKSVEHARAVAAFVEARLIVADDARSLSFSHEALLVAWGALALWIDEERADRVEAASLETASRMWRAAARDVRGDLLLRAGRLARALDLARRRPDLAAQASDLIEASRKRASRDGRVKNVLVLGVLLVAGGIVAAGAWVNKQHDEDIKLREENLKTLVRDAGNVRRDANVTATKLAEREAEAKKLFADMKGCKDTLVRVEQEHRAALSAKYAGDSFEAKVVTFLLQFEHLWNLHDADRIGAYFGERVEWFGPEAAREDVVKQLETTWQKSPSNRLLLGEIAVIKRTGPETLVRITREERTGGTQNLSVTQVVVTGEKAEQLKITRATLERTITSGKPLGCN